MALTTFTFTNNISSDMEFLDYYERLIANDPEAFKIFEEQFREFMLAIIRMHLSDKISVLDCYHELLLTIRQKLNTFDKEKPIRPFLRSITRNFALQHTRRIIFEKKTFIKDYHIYTHTADNKHQIDQLTMKRIELIKAIIKDNIGDNDIWAAVLKYRDDLSYIIIADLLLCKVDMARTHAARGVNKLYIMAMKFYPEYFEGYKYE